MSQPPPIIASLKAATPAQPGWFGALRGVWLLTWRSQLALRKLPGQLGAMLVLPILIYMTVHSPAGWNARRLFFGDSARVLRDFSRRFQRDHTRLQAETTQSLARILAEENAWAATTWQEHPDETPDARVTRLKDHIAEWDSRILSRAKTVLEDSQYTQFKTFQERDRDNTVRRLTQVGVPWTRTEPFYHWLIDFYFFIILPLTCVRGCGPLIRDELQADTLGFLITRPVGRAQLLIVKYLSQVAWLEIILLLETLLLFAAGQARQIPSLGALLPLMLGVQLLVVPAWSALGLLLGQITARYMATALIYGGIVEMGIGRIPTNINTLSIIRHLQTLLSHNAALQSIYSWPPGETLTALCALLIAPAIFLGLAALIFSMLEYHHAAEMQK